MWLHALTRTFVCTLAYSQHMCLVIAYRIAGNFRKVKILKKAEFKGLRKNNFENQLARD